MAIFIIAFIYLLTQSYLILNTAIVIYPEIYLFPWLVQKGLIPYRDFFDHHGFLLNYLLSPFVESTFSHLRLVYFIIQSANLGLLFVILRKITNKAGFIYCGFTYIFINYFLSENFLWYEAIITTIYLIIYLLLITKDSKRVSITIGLFIAIASFIKLNAAIILIPILLIKKRYETALTFFLSWALVLIYFSLNNALPQFIDSVFRFNSFLISNLNQSITGYWTLKKFIFFVSLISSYIFIFGVINKKLPTLLLTFFVLVSSTIFISSGGFKEHFLPLGTFFIILIAIVIKSINSFKKTIFALLLSLFAMDMIGKNINQFRWLQANRTAYQEDLNSKALSNEMNSINAERKTFYIFSNNHVEGYIFLNQIPPTYFPIKFPFVEKYFSNYEERILSEINGVHFMITPKSPEGEVKELKKVKKYIQTHYSLRINTKQYQIYSK